MSNHRAVLHSLYSGFGVFCFALLGGASSAGAVDVDPISVNNDNPFAILEVFDDKARLGLLTTLQIAKIIPIFLPPESLNTATTMIAFGPHAKAAPNYGALQIVPAKADADLCAGSQGVAVNTSGNFVYMSGGFGSPGRLCGFRIDPVSYVLTPVMPPLAIGANAGAVAIDPAGRYVYTSGNGVNGNVSGFALDRATGVPTALPGSPYATNGELPNPIVIDRTGRFLYVGQSVGSFNGSIAVFAIDVATGVLTPVPGSPFPTLAGDGRAAALALSPDGRFLFAGGSVIATYALDPITGVPTRTKARVGNYFGVTVDPTGRFLYALEYFSSVVQGFSIATDGTLAPVGTPQPIGSESRGIVSIADLLYVASRGTDQTFGFRINSVTGALSPVAGSPFATPSKPNGLAATGSLPVSGSVDVGDNVVARIGVYGGRAPYMWSLTSGALPPGMTLNSATGVVSGVVNAAGTYPFTVQVTDHLGASASAARSIQVVGGATPIPVTVFEFYNASLDHYFITHAADEIAKLDDGTFKGWARTGLTFNAFTAAAGGTSAVCRIYIPPGKGDGHFFGRDVLECDGTISKNPTFILESGTFLYLYPPTLGNCASGQVPVYRVFSNRADANHRYTTDRAVRDQMVGKGWLAEGDGADTVVMCAPV